MQRTPTSQTTHWLPQYLDNAFESPAGSNKEDLGLPLSNISTPKRTEKVEPSIPRKLGMPTLGDVSTGGCMRLVPKSSRKFSALSSTEMSESSRPSVKTKLDNEPSISTSVECQFELALVETKALIRKYSQELAKVYKAANGLNTQSLGVIENQFESEKNALYSKFDIPGDKIKKYNRIISEHFHELVRCLKSDKPRLAASIIKSLNENFIGFAKDGENTAHNHPTLNTMQ